VTFARGFHLAAVLMAGAAARADTTSPGERGELDRLERECAADPGNVKLRVALGQAYLSRKDAKRAIAELNRAITVDPEFEPAYVALVIAYLDASGNADDAEVTLSQALVHFPRHAGMHNLLANVNTVQAQHGLGAGKLTLAAAKLESATSHYQAALDLPASKDVHAGAHLGLGSALQLECYLLRLRQRFVQADEKSAAASASFRAALALRPELQAEIRDFEIDLSLPRPHFPKDYALTHLSVTLEERLRRIRSQLVGSNR
jgi:tetratricopeptide (TPR) repeat protein